jgi:predicted transposase/invertase (TIGR01784 family)
MPPEMLGEKFCRLDINMEVNRQRVDLEVQVDDEGNYPARSLYYWAREFSSARPVAGRYEELPRTIVASIMAFKLFPCAEYYSEYEAREVTRHTPLSDKMSLIFFELPKLPKEVKADNGLELWLSLFRARTEEELAELAELGVPEVSEAIEAYHQITATSEFQEAERLRFKARHDEAQALYNAERKMKFEFAKKLLAKK